MKLLPMADSDYLYLRKIYDRVPKNSDPAWKFIVQYPIKGLYRMENLITPEYVMHYKRLTPHHPPVRIVVFEGKRYIWDGNHRVHARLNKGLKTVNAFVAEIQ